MTSFAHAAPQRFSNYLGVFRSPITVCNFLSNPFRIEILNTKHFHVKSFSWRVLWMERGSYWWNKFIQWIIDSEAAAGTVCSTIFATLIVNENIFPISGKRCRQIDVFLFSSMTQTTCHRELATAKKRLNIMKRYTCMHDSGDFFGVAMKPAIAALLENGMLILIFIDYSSLPPTIATKAVERALNLLHWIL